MEQSNGLSAELLGLLRCPVTGSPLAVLTAEETGSWNRRIEKGEVTARNGAAVRLPVDEGLINSSRDLIIPVRNGIVQMVEDQLIPVDQAR